MNLNQQHPKHGGVRWVHEGHGSDKKCPIDNHVKMISPTGDVVDVALATGSNIPRARNMAYEAHILQTKEAKGWVRYDSLGESEREQLIAERSGRKRDLGNRMNEQFKTGAERMAEASQANFDKLINAMSENIPARKGRKSGDE